MPFAVTLMAKLGVEGQSTARDLLDAWSESGPDMLSNDLEQSMNRSIGLSVESYLVKRNPDATTLLAILSLLPAGTTKENLRWWAPALKTSMLPSAIATLSQAGLLVENKRENSTSPVFFVLPVIQSFMQQKDRIAEDIWKQIHSSCCEYVLAHACRLDDPTFPKNSKALAAEDTNIQSILFGSPPSQPTVLPNRTIEALIAFSWHRRDTKPNLEIVNHALTAAKSSRDVRYIASAVWCLGVTYHQLGDHLQFFYHLKEAYGLFNTLPPGEVESQRLGGQCGIDLMNAAGLVFQDLDQVVSLAREVKTKCAALSDDVIHGRSLVYLGDILRRAGQPHEALHYLDQARTMLKAAGNTYSLADAHQLTSWLHYDEGRLLEAQDAMEEAWKLVEWTENPSFQADISLDLARALFHTNRDTEAWEYLELTLTKASYVGNRYRVAQALQYMGHGYLRRGDYQNALGAYEAAAEKYLGTANAHAAQRCNDYVARIKQKQGNIDMVIGFHRPAIDFDSETRFYPPVQASVSDVPIFGS
jgi:tetratricopeptide (TPR) repeat protein